jgi:hypothetical protein
MVGPTFDPANGNGAAISIAPFGGLPPCGGFMWFAPPTNIFSVTAAPTAVVNGSELSGAFVNAGAPNRTTTFISLGVAGFVPAGGYLSLGLTGTITGGPTGGTVSFLGSPAVIAVNLASNGGQGMGQDYAQGSAGLGGTDRQLATQDPAFFGISPNAGLLETPVAGGIGFLAYAISSGPDIAWSTGTMYTMDFTLTITADPGVRFAFVDPGEFNPKLARPRDAFGAFATSVPEPGSLSLAGLGLFGLLACARRKRSVR